MTSIHNTRIDTWLRPIMVYIYQILCIIYLRINLKIQQLRQLCKFSWLRDAAFTRGEQWNNGTLIYGTFEKDSLGRTVIY